MTPVLVVAEKNTRNVVEGKRDKGKERREARSLTI